MKIMGCESGRKFDAIFCFIRYKWEHTQQLGSEISYGFSEDVDTVIDDITTCILDAVMCFRCKDFWDG